MKRQTTYVRRQRGVRPTPHNPDIAFVYRKKLYVLSFQNYLRVLAALGDNSRWRPILEDLPRLNLPEGKRGCGNCILHHPREHAAFSYAEARRQLVEWNRRDRRRALPYFTHTLGGTP